MVDRNTLRIGSVSALIGAIVFGIGGALRPDTGNPEVIEEVLEGAKSVGQFTAHGLLVSLGVILILGALVALREHLRKGTSGAWARFALVAAIVGSGLFVVAAVSDALVLSKAAEAHAGASADEASIGLRVAQMAADLAYGVFALAVAVEWAAILLFGLAISLADRYPKWLGWAAVVVGAVGFVDGAIIGASGPTDVLEIVFIAVAVLTSLWVFVLGVLMWRRSGQVA